MRSASASRPLATRLARPRDAAAAWGGEARVFHGDQDKTCPPEYGVRYAQALHCDAVAIPGAGHTFDNLDQVEDRKSTRLNSSH